MSRLDSFIARMIAARACLDHAARLTRDLAGPVFEFGLGNGRTFDHLREICPDRDIFVFERAIAAHPDCIPAPDRLILGDLRQTLPQLRQRFAARAALAHVDIGNHDEAVSRRLLGELAPLLAPLLRPGAIVVSEPPFHVPGWAALPLPEGIKEGRYHLYRAS